VISPVHSLRSLTDYRRLLMSGYSFAMTGIIVKLSEDCDSVRSYAINIAELGAVNHPKNDQLSGARLGSYAEISFLLGELACIHMLPEPLV
jgi:hypothetical protein